MTYHYRSPPESGHYYYTPDASGRPVLALAPLESGQVTDLLGQLGKALGGELVAPALSEALADPVARAQIQSLIREALDDPQTRAAARSYLIEAALWVGAGVFGGYTLFRLLFPTR